MSTDVLVSVDSLTKRYPGVTALDALTFDVTRGVIGLVGANGAGKSTLMKILMGLADPTSGSARVFGFNPQTEGLSIRELIGYMPEHDCLPQDISATQFVIHMARMSGIPAVEARERTAEILRHVGLFEERYRKIGTYSTGMKQRVKLAQALVHDPRLLFLDEPTNGLDPNGRDAMLGLIRRTGEAFGISVVMSSHLLGEIESVCDALVVIDAGALVRAGQVSTFTGVVDVLAVELDRGADELASRLVELGLDATSNKRTVAVRLSAGHDDHSVNRIVIGAIAELGLPMVSLARQRASLGDLFREPGGQHV